MASFLTSAVLTFITIVGGYLSDSLPDAALTELDRAFLTKIWKTVWRPWPRKGLFNVMVQCSTGILAWAGITIVSNDQIRGADKKRIRDRERRSRALERFVLALSDQQLVTGLAVLIAGYINRCTMSVYHFNIVTALAWFSSTTHLSTLAVLRVYLINHQGVRNWRVAAMLGILGLLVFAQFGSLCDTSNNGLPVQCILESSWLGSRDPAQLALVLVIVAFLVNSYSNRIGRLYTLDPDWSLQEWVVKFLVWKMPWKSRKKTRLPHLERIIIASSKRPKAEQSAMFRILRQRQRLEQARLRKTRGRYFHIVFLSQQLSNAFLNDLLTLLFGVTFGITRTIVYRRSVPTAGLSGSQNTMGFGQLVPLILMVLPALAASEAYFGKVLDRPLNGKLLTSCDV